MCQGFLRSDRFVDVTRDKLMSSLDAISTAALALYFVHRLTSAAMVYACSDPACTDSACNCQPGVTIIGVVSSRGLKLL